jgi:ABC-type Zn2+ transport system substrate-binding protein/surface adhesin
MITRKEFADDEDTSFTTEEHWNLNFFGAWIRIHKPEFSFDKEGNLWHLWLFPEAARAVAAELIAIADSVDRQQAEFERKRKQ